LGSIDPDVVDLSNLQRQIIHSTDEIGRTQGAQRRGANRGAEPRRHRDRTPRPPRPRQRRDGDRGLRSGRRRQRQFRRPLPDQRDLRHRLGKTLVSAALVRFEGQLSTYKTHAGGPCYRCLFPEPPDPDLVPRCDTVGIFGAVAGVMGSLQATEVLKELLGLGTSMAGQLLLFDALDQTFRKIKVARDPDCPVCGAGAG
jgi:molybdopterin/thiamine biosynthesis adenylyltransferase